ncbi:MAG TPA: hypothetical protein VIL30_04895 [Ramlibacter sp.]|jgi:hypothetical protein
MTTLRSGTSEGRLLVWVLLLGAAVTFALAVDAWRNPLPLPSARPLKWIAFIAYELTGRAGLAGIWAGVSIACVLVSRWAWRHTPKLPTDRWWRA